jgi:hypothetical protein
LYIRYLRRIKNIRKVGTGIGEIDNEGGYLARPKAKLVSLEKGAHASAVVWARREECEGGDLAKL